MGTFERAGPIWPGEHLWIDVVEEHLSVQSVIAHVPENVRLYDGPTAAENLRFFARLPGGAEAGVEWRKP